MKNDLESARNYVFRLFKLRPRSEFELRRKLTERKFSREIIEQTINFCKESRLVDDFEFARFWISSRVIRPLGMKRLFYELKLKGVSEDLIKLAAAEFKDSYDENRIVAELALAKFNKIKGIEKYKAKSRVYAYLSRRGFSPGVVNEVVKGL